MDSYKTHITPKAQELLNHKKGEKFEPEST